MRRTRLAIAGVLAGLAAVPASAEAVTLEPIGTAAYSDPTYVTSDPTNPDRLFVTEQGGRILETTPTGTSPFLDLTDKTAIRGEEGLWSIAFAPDFAATGLFYVAYTAREDSPVPDHTPALFEYRAQATPAETEATERLVLAVEDDPVSNNHNGGQLHFGPDGYLYWSVGEDDVGASAQTLSNLRGKILRIDPRATGSDPYTVPADNPHLGADPGKDEIWAHGLRNPWRFSFDRLTGDLTVADVGEVSFEEVNVVPAASGGGRGVDFGWPECEAFAGTACTGPERTPPIYAYSHAFNPGGGDAIAGGYVVRDPDLGDLYGRYLFADTYSGIVASIDPTAPPAVNGQRPENVPVEFPVSFGEDACGRLYIVAADNAQVYRLEGPSGGACPAVGPDTDPPETTLRLKRKNRRGTKYIARIGSDEPGSTFECKLDKRKWKPCQAKRKLKRLDPGRHRFRARATDAAGNTDPKPAKEKFRTKRPG